MRAEPLPQTILSRPFTPPQESNGKGRDGDCSNPIAMTKLREGLVAMVVGAALSFPVLLVAELLPEPLAPGRTQAVECEWRQDCRV